MAADPAVQTGTLENGFQYLIRPNGEPQNRISFRLAVRSGSVHEDDDQTGIAHFVEHMAFNGSTHFTKNTLIDYFESIGMKFGPEVNAYTSFNETVYKLDIPADDPEILKTTLQVLQDWAMGLSFDEAEIDKERGVVIEEWRLGRGANGRLMDIHLPVLFGASRYAKRLPIGSPDTIRNLSYQRIRDFYTKWYRSDRMALVVSGVVDPAVMASEIGATFSQLPKPARKIAEPDMGSIGEKTVRVSIATDPELPYGTLEIYNPQPARPLLTAEGYRASLVRNLAMSVLNQRLQEKTLEADPDFLASAAGYQRIVRDTDFSWLVIVPPENATLRGFDSMLEVYQRLARFGLTAAELEREKASALNRIEQAWLNRDKQRSSDLADRILSSWLEGSVYLDMDSVRSLGAEYMSGIAIEEVNAVLKNFLSSEQAGIMVSLPESTAEVPDTAALAERYRNFRLSDDSAQYDEGDLNRPLYNAAQSGGSVVAEEVLSERGVTMLTLSNGARVIFYPTDFKNDEIQFWALSEGGFSMVEDDAFPSALVMGDLQSLSGLNGFGPVDLQKKLAGKTVSIDSWVSDSYEGLSGSSSVRDLETLFQLTALHFTAPEASESAWQSLLSRLNTVAANRLTDPEEQFSDLKQQLTSSSHPRERPLNAQLISEMRYADAKALYRERFADAGDFIFIFVGSLDPAVVKDLSARYLAVLPGSGKTEAAVDRGVRFPAGIVSGEIHAGKEPKSAVYLAWGGELEGGAHEEEDLDFLAALLQIRLREVIREDMSGTYGVGVNSAWFLKPIHGYKFSVQFGCEPGREEELRAAVLREIEWVKNGGADETYLQKLRETHRKGLETAMRNNGFWLETLGMVLVVRDLPLSFAEQLPALADELTTERLADMAARYLKTDNYVQAVLYPAE